MGNTATGLYGGGKVARLNQDRAVHSFQPFGGADAIGPWDVNDPKTFESRTASSGGIKTVTVSGATWTTDQWKGYTIRKTSTCSGNCYAIIHSNTANTITFSDSAAFGEDILSFQSGDKFSIGRVLQVLDGVGRGGGSAMSGGAEETAPPKPSKWNDQTAFPLYEWLNTNNGVDMDFGLHGSCVGTCRKNEHYYDSTPSAAFDGSGGVGAGKIGARPSKCTAGVWYWATDEGEWDSTNAGADGRGYKCTATNVWALAYTPYSYPHPLVTPGSNSNDSTAPAPANGGKIIASKPTATSVVLTWTEATDNASAQWDLEYEIRRSATNNISTVATAETNGLVASPYTAGIDSVKVKGLTPSTSYYFNIIVRDESGNKQVYSAVKATTAEASSDNSPPTVFVATPDPGSVVSGNVVLSAAADDDDGEVTNVQFFLDGYVSLGAVSAEPYELSWDTRDVPDGLHILSSRARDAANHETVSVGVVVTVSNLTKTYSLQLDGAASFRSPGAAGASTSTSYAVIAPSPGTPLPRGVAVIGFETGGVLRAEASVPAAPEINSGIVYADISKDVNTGLAVANESTQDAVVSYTFTDGGGAVAGEGAFTVEAGRQTSFYFSSLNVPHDFKGTFKFVSTAPVGVVSIRVTTNKRGETVFTTLPVNPTTGIDYSPVIPLFADGGGWATNVVLTNPSSAQQTGTVQFWGPGSEDSPAELLVMNVNGTQGSTFYYDIPPYSMVSLATSGQGSARVGSVRVIPDASQFNAATPSALAILSFHDNKGVIVSEAGVTARPLGTAFRTFVEVAPGPASVVSGVAIVNPGASSVTVSLQLYNPEGTPVETMQGITLPAGGQISRFINELFPTLPAEFQGTLSVIASFPIGVTGLRSRSNSEGAFLISAIPPLNESEPLENAVLFPHIVRGGGFSTQLILMAPPSQSGSGQIMVRY